MNKKKIFETTVVVLCYNAEKTIKETLDSVFAQDYRYIHLIISDDCSSDSTIQMAKEWCNNYSSRFLSTEILIQEQNQGISRHINEVVNKVNTEWFFILAGDDIMLKDCVKSNVIYARKNNLHGIIYSNMISFSESELKRKYKIDFEELIYQKKFGKLDSQQQHSQLIKREILCSPTMFFHKSDFLLCGGCDESIRNIDDWPLKIRMTANGVKLNYFNKYTVLYRMGDSISRSNNEYFRVSFLEEIKKVKKKYCDSYLKSDRFYMWNEKVNNLRFYVVVKIFHNRRTVLTNLINTVLALPNTDKMKKAIVNTIMMPYGKWIIKCINRKYKLEV